MVWIFRFGSRIVEQQQTIAQRSVGVQVHGSQGKSLKMVLARTNGVFPKRVCLSQFVAAMLWRSQAAHEGVCTLLGAAADGGVLPCGATFVRGTGVGYANTGNS